MASDERGAQALTVQVTRSEADYEGAAPALVRALDERPGMFFRSGTEAPGRYARWDLGLCQPALELRSRGRRLRLRALDADGERLLTLFGPALQAEPTVATVTVDAMSVVAELSPMAAVFAEEERSRQPSVFTALRALLKALRGAGGADGYLGFYGAFGYDLVFQFEPIAQRHARSAEGVDDCVLYLPLAVLVVDRRRETAHWHRYCVQTPAGPAGPPPLVASAQGDARAEAPASSTAEVRSDQSVADFLRKVEQVKAGCARGDFFEVVLSQEFQVPCALAGSQIFDRLSARNPSPYLFYFNLGQEQLIGSSPEMFLRVEDGRTIETCPIAGTIRRGADAVEDAVQRARLYGSLKDESELTMCTDVDRNDLCRVCEPGSVRLLGRRLLETYSKLIHTVDHVAGTLRPECDALDGFVSHMWACTVTGAPKKIALQTIEDLEESPRGYYAGAIGFAAANGTLNSGITLRTVHLRDGVARVRAGATLLYDSEPEAEEQETRLKAAALLDAILRDDAAVAATAEAPRLRAGEGRRVLFVDCEDSFVQTLASYVRSTGAHVTTYRPGFPESLLDDLRPDLLFLSPGPKAPRDFDLSRIIGWAVARRLPIFGVCLGHQALGEHFGGALAVLPAPVHGKPTEIAHDGAGIFAGLPQGFTVARYHSLHVVESALPAVLQVTARSPDGVVMALRHRALPIAGVQFHPESILTLQGQHGLRLLNNVFKSLCPRADDRGHA